MTDLRLTACLIAALMPLSLCSCRALPSDTTRLLARSMPPQAEREPIQLQPVQQQPSAQQLPEQPSGKAIALSLGDQQSDPIAYSTSRRGKPVVVRAEPTEFPANTTRGVVPAAYEQWRGGWGRGGHSGRGGRSAVRPATMPSNTPSHVTAASYNGPVPPAYINPHGVTAGCSCCSPPSLPDYYPDLALRGREEIICNGGDNATAVKVTSDWSVYGLQLGDTVAHYDTVDGQVEVAATNDICLYAPRFAAVRKVTGVVLHEQQQGPRRLETDQQLATEEETQFSSTVARHVQASRHMKSDSLQSFRDPIRSQGVDNMQRPTAVQSRFLPFEDFAIIRRGVFDNTQKARLSTSLEAASSWTSDAEVQVMMGGKAASEAANEVAMQSVYHYEMPEGKSRMRVVKVASKQNARPGETVEFTIRFDNVGDQVIGNVTIVDNLVARLEYVDDSQSCSVTANFRTQANDGESLVLRWEVLEPLEVGDGGVIKFTCRVR